MSSLGPIWLNGPANRSLPCYASSISGYYSEHGEDLSIRFYPTRSVYISHWIGFKSAIRSAANTNIQHEMWIEEDEDDGA